MTPRSSQGELSQTEGLIVVYREPFEESGPADFVNPFDKTFERVVGNVGVTIEPLDDDLVVGTIEVTETTPNGGVSTQRKPITIPPELPGFPGPRAKGEVFPTEQLLRRTVNVRFKPTVGRANVVVRGERSGVRVLPIDPRVIAAR